MLTGITGVKSPTTNLNTRTDLVTGVKLLNQVTEGSDSSENVPELYNLNSHLVDEELVGITKNFEDKLNRLTLLRYSDSRPSSTIKLVKNAPSLMG